MLELNNIVLFILTTVYCLYQTRANITKGTMTKLSTNHHNLNNNYKPVADQTKNTDKLESDLGDTMDWG